MTHIFSSARRIWNGGAARRFQIVLGALALGLAGWVVLVADKPWEFSWSDADQWRLRELVGFYTFWAGLLNGIGLACLAITARWWAGGESKSAAVVACPVTSRSAAFWPVVLAAVLFCGVAAGLRMNFGLAHDENYSARRVIAGTYEVDAAGRVALDPVSWQETFFYYRKPNNHVFHSILARLAWSVWMGVAPGESWQIREWVIRLPAWLGGIGAVAALAVLLRATVSAQAGMLAAWLLAVHPWFLRYASEARGYSLVMALIPVVLLLWIRALQRGGWRWWLGWAAAEFLLVFCYPAAVYVLVVLNGLTLVWFLWRRPRLPTVARWFVANVLAAMAALQAMLPLVPQLRAYMQTGEARMPLSLDWIASTASHFLLGTSWNLSKMAEPLHLEGRVFAAAHPVLFWTVVGVLGLLMALGAVRMLARPWPVTPIVALTLLAPGFLSLAMAWSSGQWLFEWYLIYLLLGFVAVAAAGVDWLGASLRRPGVSLAAGAAVIFAFAGMTQSFRATVCVEPLDAIKEAAEYARGTLDPNASGHDRTLTGAFPNTPSYYDPRARLLKTPEDLFELMREADASRKTLAILVSHPWAAAYKSPQLWRLFNESGLFHGHRMFRGYDGTRDWVVAHYQPGTLDGFDWNAFQRGREAVPDANRPPLAYPDKPEMMP